MELLPYEDLIDLEKMMRNRSVEHFSGLMPSLHIKRAIVTPFPSFLLAPICRSLARYSPRVGEWD
jgi:hypothetical protein